MKITKIFSLKEEFPDIDRPPMIGPPVSFSVKGLPVFPRNSWVLADPPLGMQPFRGPVDDNAEHYAVSLHCSAVTTVRSGERPPSEGRRPPGSRARPAVCR